MTQVVESNATGAPAASPDTGTEANGEPGLRERKKRATRRALQRAALELVAECSLDEVTVEQIAAAADVSTRTFFNYFATKEEALAAVDPEVLEDKLAVIASRPAAERPLQVMRVIASQLAEQMKQDLEFWQLRGTVVHHYPELGARLIGASVAAEQRIALALAERMGVDARIDPRPRLVAGAATVAHRSAVATWLLSEQQRDLSEVLNECFDSLAALDSLA